MDNTLAGLYMEDKHMALLERIFQLYKDHGLLINPDKTKLSQALVDFLNLNLS